MTSKNKKQHSSRPLPSRYFVFLNPDLDSAFTRCPKCTQKTKVRKFCLVIHVEPRNLIILNKSTRYCPFCELVIVHQHELESQLSMGFEKHNPDIIGNPYMVLGTVERTDWKEGMNNPLQPQSFLETMYPFKDQLHFQAIQPHWCSGKGCPKCEGK